MKFTINSEDTLSQAIGILRKELKDVRYFTMSVLHGKKRTQKQNNNNYRWYNQISRELVEHTNEEIMCLCKFHLGLPILRGDDEDYNAICVREIDPLPYEHQILAMKYFPVTRLMTTKQLKEYQESIIKNHLGRVELKYNEDE